MEERSGEAYREDFLGRFDTLGRSLAVSTQQTEAALSNLVQAVMQPYLEDTSVITLEGEEAIA